MPKAPQRGPPIASTQSGLSLVWRVRFFAASLPPSFADAGQCGLVDLAAGNELLLLSGFIDMQALAC